MDRTELLVCAVIGLGLIVGGAFWATRRLDFLKHCLHAQGTVVEQREKTGSKFTTYYYPVVEFRTENGEKVQFVGGAGSSGGPLIQTGSTVEVVYDPADPSQARIKSFTQYWLGPVGIAAMGLALALTGIFFFWRAGMK
jgi:hypothetical protein